MTVSAPTLIAETTAAVGVLSGITRDVAAYQALDDEALLEVTKQWSRAESLTKTHAALAAGELARRSAREFGSNGLAQRHGHRTPEELVRATTGVTKREASTAVRAGRLAVEAAGSADSVTGELPPMTQPWLAGVGAALVAGTISVEGAESIRNGLGEPTAEITVEVLAGAVTELLGVASRGVDADQLFRVARDFRNVIDETGIKHREQARYEARSLRFFRNADGSARLVWDMDPETAATVGDLYDRSTSPRRQQPRFADTDTDTDTDADKATSRRMVEDPRTTEQFTSDLFVELLRQGANADTSQLLGTGAPTVMVYVTKDTLTKGEGHGYLAGLPEPVSLETVERHICTGGTQQIIFDTEGNPLDLEREQRLFTAKQKKVLASKWGGCGVAGCGKPASWTEAHHTQHWGRDHGATNIDDGILLCGFHHQLFHANGWETVRRDHRYWLIDPNGNETELIPKNPTWHDLRRARTG